MSIYQELHTEVFRILETQLPPYLTYHSPDHTARVIEKAEWIAGHEKVSAHDLDLIRIAALFHDIGFIRARNHHEEISGDICTGYLQQYHVHPDDIQKIYGMIMATRIPQQPDTLLEKIVADADLEYLGTSDFYPISQRLFEEFRHFDPLLTLEHFNEVQIHFMRKHHYHTAYCKKHRNPQKQAHLRALMQST